MLMAALAACFPPPSPTATPPLPTATAAPTQIAMATEPPPPTQLPPAQTVPPRVTPTLVSRAVATALRITPGAANRIVYVANTGGSGVTLRTTPGGEAITVLADGAQLTATGEERQSGGQIWKEVRDQTGTTGWVVAAFLATSPTVRTTGQPALPPTMPIGLIPTVTYASTPPAVTRTPVPVRSPVVTPTVLPTPAPISTSSPVPAPILAPR
jgi:hypothetical protein